MELQSPTSSVTDFSFVAASNTSNADETRSRSSTHSYGTVEVADESSSIMTFSDIGSPGAQSMGMGGNQVISVSNSFGEDDDDFVLIPPPSAALGSSPVRNAPDGGAARTANDHFQVLSRMSSSLLSHKCSPDEARATREEADSDDDDEGDDVHQHDEDSAAEEAARARLRARESTEPDDADDYSDEESILFTGVKNLSISQTISTTPIPSTVAPSRKLLPALVDSGDNRFPSTLDLDFIDTRNTPTPTLRTPVQPAGVGAEQPRTSPIIPSPVKAPVPITTIHPTVGEQFRPSVTQIRAARRRRAKAKAVLQKIQQGGNSDNTSSSSAPSSPTIYDAPRSGETALHEDAMFSTAMYKEAVEYVTAYLNDPPLNASSDVRLHFLQSLIIELGLLNKSGIELPTSCKAAKRLLQSHVHINVREYVRGRTRGAAMAPVVPQTKAQRKKLKKKGEVQTVPSTSEIGVGLEELQKLMYPSKVALARSLFTGCRDDAGVKHKPVSVKWIKRRGLGVFLVSYRHP